MKRRLTKLVVFLLLGAVVNVAVAWGCAYWIDEERKSHTLLLGPIPFEDAGWHIIIYEKPGAIRVVAFGVDHLGFAHWREKLGSDVSREELERAIEESKPYFCTVAEVEARLPSWSRANHPPQARARTSYPIEDARGWPLISMRCSMDDYTARLRLGDPNHTARQFHPEVISVVQENRVVFRHKKTGRILSEVMLADGDGVRNGILLPPRVLRPTSLYQLRALPLRPIWPGFAINTIFYAAVLWRLTFGPFTARRMIRRKRGHLRLKRGHCTKCGYDLRGTSGGGGGGGCPECG